MSQSAALSSNSSRSERRTTPAPRPVRVLVVDDDRFVLGSILRMLSSEFSVATADGVTSALELLGQAEFDAVVSDVSMPNGGGMALLRAIRARSLDLPVLFMTGVPTVETAAEAVELGAFRYLAKPVRREVLQKGIHDAFRSRAIVRAPDVHGERAALDEAFRRFLDTMWIAYQPIVGAASQTLYGYEALLRSVEPALPHPGAVLEAAEKLGALHDLGRRVRSSVSEAIASIDRSVQIFVNLHPADLADADLYDPYAPLSSHAHRVVLELTERASLEAVSDVRARVALLRGLGYRVAVDDLGAGYAGLNYFALIEPDVAKIDMSLVRSIDTDPVKTRVVRSLVELTRGLGMEVVAEGVETTAERDCLVGLGCTMVQGYLLGKPQRGFQPPVWK